MRVGERGHFGLCGIEPGKPWRETALFIEFHPSAMNTPFPPPPQKKKKKKICDGQSELRDWSLPPMFSSKFTEDFIYRYLFDEHASAYKHTCTSCEGRASTSLVGRLDVPFVMHVLSLHCLGLWQQGQWKDATESSLSFLKCQRLCVLTYSEDAKHTPVCLSCLVLQCTVLCPSRTCGCRGVGNSVSFLCECLCTK